MSGLNFDLLAIGFVPTCRSSCCGSHLQMSVTYIFAHMFVLFHNIILIHSFPVLFWVSLISRYIHVLFLFFALLFSAGLFLFRTFFDLTVTKRS